MEEHEAIQLLKQHDLSSLEELVRRYQALAVQTAYLIVGDRPLAEDITQAAFLKVAQRIHQFKDGRPFRPWFLRIVKNDAIKASARARRHLSMDVAQGLRPLPSELMNVGDDPEEMAGLAEEKRLVWEALQKLTPRQRAAIVMRYFLDMKGPEISKELSRPLSSVKWSIHAAKERLRALLGSREAPTVGSSARERSKRAKGEKQ
jgi:RNA polymerase sigma-70 factor (ECF subfamily)